jgi:hypothetical protein
MEPSPDPHYRYRFSVELLLAERGVTVSYGPAKDPLAAPGGEHPRADRQSHVSGDRHRLSQQRRALEHAQSMAAHKARTAKLYDRSKERLTQDEMERIRL